MPRIQLLTGQCETNLPALTSAGSEGHGIRIRKGPTRGQVQISFAMEAEQYNALQVRMRASAGKHCVLKWVSDLEPDFHWNPGTRTPIVADNVFHNYLIPLNGVATWAGHIEKLRFSPSEVPADVEIASMGLLYRPIEGPRRITIKNDDIESQEAIFGTATLGPVPLPQNPRLEVNLALGDRAYFLREARGVKPYVSDGARFSILLEQSSGETTTLIERTLNPLNQEDDGVGSRSEICLFGILEGRGRWTFPADGSAAAYMIALYDDGIRMVDHYLKEFFDWLKVVGVYDRSLIIVTSDHGEEFGDHGSYLHEQIYEEVCRIPLLMKFPQQAFGGRARCVFESSSERIEGQRSKGQHILDGSKDFRHFNPV